MADQVTISTFLELRDNMSAGLQKIVDALSGVASKASDAQEAIAKKAEAGLNRVKKAKTEEQQATERAAALRRRIEINSARMASAAAQKAEADRIRAQNRAEAAARREAREVTNALRRIEAERIRAERQAEALARREANARIREEERVAREARRIERERVAAEARAARDRARIERAESGKPKGLFGTMVGANIVSDIAMRGLDMAERGFVGFFDKVKEEGLKYEMQIYNIASSMFTRGLIKDYDTAEKKATELMGNIIKMAAKLPGEATDYVQVFQRTLPTALSAGMKDVDKFADFVSKYTAFSTGKVDPSMAGTQLLEMMQGHVRVTTRMWSELAQFTGLNQKQLNDKTLPAYQRLMILMQGIEKAASAQVALEKSGESLFGTLKSTYDLLFVQEGSPFFESQKIAATELVKILESPVIRKTLLDISEGLGDAMVGLVVYLERFVGFLNEMRNAISSMPGLGWLGKAAKAQSPLGLFFGGAMDIGAQKRAEWRAQNRPEMHASTELVPSPPGKPKEKPENNFDFRYSRFDIRQEFAEGFDPDRIAVAFATDLGKMATAKLGAASAIPAGAN